MWYSAWLHSAMAAQLTGWKGKNKAMPVTGCGGSWGCKTSRRPHFLDSQLIDGGESMSLVLDALYH
jgi:hypothetical protein